MRKSPFIIFALILASVLCFTVIFPTAASGSDRGPDAIMGARTSLTQHHASSFDIVSSAHKGGTVSASRSDSRYGDAVMFAVIPDDGYETASITVITASGNVLELAVRDGNYSYIMPCESVVIDVTFQYIRT